MVSFIDPTTPADGVPASKAALRSNLQAAKDEIEALQAQIGGITPYLQNGMRNRLINGNMILDQRNDGLVATSVASGTTVFGLDRWYGASITGGGVFSMKRELFGGPIGFPRFMRITTTTAKAVLDPGNAHAVVQAIEGYHWQDMLFGGAFARTSTLSFWVRASIAGIYTVSLSGPSSLLTVPNTYTVNNANEWEFKTVSFVGCTSGTWIVQHDACIGVRFDLGSGSDHTTATTNVWNASKPKIAGTVSPISTLNATLDITGVQLEQGTSASPYEYRLVALEFALVQRYYAKGQFNCGGYSVAGGGEFLHVQVGPIMRAMPTITRSGETITNLSSTTVTPTAYGFYLTGIVNVTGVWNWAATYTADMEIIV